jgi:hypothetical protein
VSDVTSVIDDLHAGRITLDQAAGEFRGRQWPVRPRHPGGPLEADAAGDIEPEPDGGFAEVEHAYHTGLISDAQYQQLAEAAAEAMAAGGGPAGGGETPQGMLDAHAARMDDAERLPWAIPSLQAVTTAHERGRAAWPGPGKTALTAAQWAAGRAKAFLALAGGDPVPPGYQRDHDLLPDGHPARPGPPA